MAIKTGMAKLKKKKTNILYCFYGAFELTPYVSHKIRFSLYSRRADDEFGEGILGNQKLKNMYYLNVSESGIDSR
jgi:hypothetical protein